MTTANAWYSAGAAMDFLRRISESKADQVAGYDQAILGVVRASLEVDAEDFVEALAAGAVVGPWARIYLVDLIREAVFVVAEADGWGTLAYVGPATLLPPSRD